MRLSRRQGPSSPGKPARQTRIRTVGLAETPGIAGLVDAGIVREGPMRDRAEASMTFRFRGQAVTPAANSAGIARMAVSSQTL